MLPIFLAIITKEHKITLTFQATQKPSKIPTGGVESLHLTRWTVGKNQTLGPMGFTINEDFPT